MGNEQYKIVCGWCGKFMGGNKNARLDMITHSICKQCKKKAMKELKEREKDKE